ncbi:MAG: ABC transporter substrate-binding protein [Candidatus Wallbacteria bacterium]|nr:ABC transporter substrate-binding protein [Candidatus Wallbacteria bacterium]
MKYTIIFVLCLFISGCGKTPKPGAGEARMSQAPAGPVQVEFWHGMGGPLGEVLKEMINQFNRSHSDIVVKGVHMGSYDTLQQKIIASLMAKTNPDIAQCYEALTIKLIDAGKLTALDRFIDADPAFNKADIVPVLLDNNRYDGVLYSLPFNKSVPVLYYNKEMFAAAGLDPEHPPANWEEFLEFSRILTKDLDGDGKPDQFGQAMTNSAWIFECMLLQAGGRLLSEDGTRVEFDSPEAVETLDYLIKTLNEAAYKTTGFDHQNDWIARKAGMVEGSCVSRTYMAANIKFDYGIAPLPAHRKQAVILSGTNVVLFKSNPDKEKAAWEFIKWFTMPDQTAHWSLSTNYIPVRKSAIDTPAMKDAITRDPYLKVLFDQLQYADFEPRQAEWYGSRQLLEQALDTALIERKDSAGYLKDITVKIIKELSGK